MGGLLLRGRRLLLLPGVLLLWLQLGECGGVGVAAAGAGEGLLPLLLRGGLQCDLAAVVVADGLFCTVGVSGNLPKGAVIGVRLRRLDGGHQQAAQDA